MVRSDGPFREKQSWRGTGVAVPVFSLRSHSSVGAGEFVDIKTLVDICAATGTPRPRVYRSRFVTCFPCYLSPLGLRLQVQS